MPHFETDDGARINLKILGEGPPLVILHGWTASHLEWLPFAGHLANRHRVYCWNARGHGDSPATTETPPTLERMARDLGNLVEAFGLERPALVGHSMGALTVLEYIRQFGTTRLQKITLIDQSPRILTDAHWRLGIYGHFTARDNEDFIARMKSDFPEAVLQLAANGLNPRIARAYRDDSRAIRQLRRYFRGLKAAPLMACWESIAAADYRDVLPGIQIPALLIHGDESQFYSLEVARYLRDRIPDAALSVYEKSDHSPQIFQPGRFLQELEAFLDGPALN